MKRCGIRLKNWAAIKRPEYAITTRIARYTLAKFHCLVHPAIALYAAMPATTAKPKSIPRSSHFQSDFGST